MYSKMKFLVFLTVLLLNTCLGDSLSLKLIAHPQKLSNKVARQRHLHRQNLLEQDVNLFALKSTHQKNVASVRLKFVHWIYVANITIGTSRKSVQVSNPFENDFNVYYNFDIFCNNWFK